VEKNGFEPAGAWGGARSAQAVRSTKQREAPRAACEASVKSFCRGYGGAFYKKRPHNKARSAKNKREALKPCAAPNSAKRQEQLAEQA